MKKTILQYLLIFLALMPFALVVNWIVLPLNIVSGGLSGVCSIIYYATVGMFPNVFGAYAGSIPVWLSSITINLLLLIIAYFTVGWRFTVRTLFGAVSAAFWYRVIPVRTTSLIEDPVMGALLGGVVFGLALGIVMTNNGSTGGTDIIAKIIHKYKDISLGNVMIACDILVIAASWMLPVPESMRLDNMTMQDITDFKMKRVLYGLCMTVAYTVAVDGIMSYMRQSVQFFIYSQKYEQIADAINTEIHRGVTMLEAKGWYSKEERPVLNVLARKHEAYDIMKLIRRIDPNAFVSQTQVRGVFGQGFQAIDEE